MRVLLVEDEFVCGQPVCRLARWPGFAVDWRAREVGDDYAAAAFTISSFST